MLIATDIETVPDADHLGDPAAGLDPRTSHVATIAFLTSHGRTAVFDIGDNTDNEGSVLEDAHRWLLTNTAGDPTLVTWNGILFDLPFLAYRLEHLGIGNPIGFNLDPNEPMIEPKYGWPAHTGAARWNTAHWAGIPHRDIAYELAAYAQANGLRNSLDPMANHFGFTLPPAIAAIKDDRANIAQHPAAMRIAYCVTDIERTFRLALESDRLRTESL